MDTMPDFVGQDVTEMTFVGFEEHIGSYEDAFMVGIADGRAPISWGGDDYPTTFFEVHAGCPALG
jgi:hypothetical protein